jgi:hypothetical protein
MTDPLAWAIAIAVFLGACMFVFGLIMGASAVGGFR